MVVLAGAAAVSWEGVADDQDEAAIRQAADFGGGNRIPGLVICCDVEEEPLGGPHQWEREVLPLE